MSVRELVILGTAAQIPTQDRNHHGALLRWDDEGLLIDPGEGSQRQLIFTELSATSITRILISHFHQDHCLGFAGICQRISLDRVPHTVDVYYPASGALFYERLRKASIYHSAAKLSGHPVDGASVVYESPKLTIEARALHHTVDCVGYRLQERDGVTMLPDKLQQVGVRGPMIGQLQRQGAVTLEDGRTVRVEDVSVPKRGQAVAFVMDTRPCRGALELAQDVDLLVCEASFIDAHADEAEKRRNMTAREAAVLAREAGAKKLVLTHFAPRYDDLTPHLEEAKAVFENTVLAQDGLRIPIERPKKPKGGAV
ncbi:MAG: ribonuclease Z [Myxococcota bacterium]